VEHWKPAVEGKPDFIGYRVDTIVLLEARRDELVTLRLEREAVLKDLAAQIMALWRKSKLDTEAERQKFVNQHSGLSLETLAACAQELSRLQARMLSSYKTALNELWEETASSAEDRSKFQSAVSGADPKDLLAMYEEETRRLTERKETIRTILELAKEHDQMKDEKLKFAQETQDPNRFKTSGFSGVNEEKKRNRLTKGYQTNLNSLRSTIATWEQQYGPFFLHGTRYLEQLDREELEEKEKAEQAKSDRKSKANNKRAAETPKSNRSLGLTMPSTPVSEDQKAFPLSQSFKSPRRVPVPKPSPSLTSPAARVQNKKAKLVGAAATIPVPPSPSAKSLLVRPPVTIDVTPVEDKENGNSPAPAATNPSSVRSSVGHPLELADENDNIRQDIVRLQS